MNAVVPVVETLRALTTDTFNTEGLAPDMAKVTESYTKAVEAIGKMD